MIVSFYTPEYSEIVKNLISSLKKFKLKYDIEERKSLGSWISNVNQKPKFILEKLKQYDKVIWLDADAIVKRHPTYFDLIEEDVGINYRNGKQTQTATVILKKTAIGLVEDWIKRAEEKPNIPDHTNLEYVLNAYQLENRISIFYLPATYCYIAGITKLGKPVIYQTQASRKMRR